MPFKLHKIKGRWEVDLIYFSSLTSVSRFDLRDPERLDHNTLCTEWLVTGPSPAWFDERVPFAPRGSLSLFCGRKSWAVLVAPWMNSKCMRYFCRIIFLWSPPQPVTWSLTQGSRGVTCGGRRARPAHAPRPRSVQKWTWRGRNTPELARWGRRPTPRATSPPPAQARFLHSDYCKLS